MPPQHSGNPYEYGAYDLIADEWPRVTDAVENGVDGADEELRVLLARYAGAFED